MLQLYCSIIIFLPVCFLSLEKNLPYFCIHSSYHSGWYVLGAQFKKKNCVFFERKNRSERDEVTQGMSCQARNRNKFILQTEECTGWFEGVGVTVVCK